MRGGRGRGAVAGVGRPVLRALVLAAGIGVALVAVTWGRVAPVAVAAVMPVVLLLYTCLFALDDAGVGALLRGWVGDDIVRGLTLPAALLLLLYGYCLAGGGNPFDSTGIVLPSILLLPVVAAVARPVAARIDGVDLALLLLFLAPLPTLRLPADAELPLGGGGFDTATRMVMLIVALYGFVCLRGLPGVGLFRRPAWRHLWTTLWVWLAFLALCLAVGLATGFVTYVGHPPPTWAAFQGGAHHLFRILLHTALFEELFFRGLLQTMVARLIHQAGRWRPAWQWGAILLTPLAAVAGALLTGGYRWLPAAMVAVLFAAAHRLERREAGGLGNYTALAIVGSGFGLVHLHTGSIVFVALAIVAGWAYGYLYLRTRRLLYPVLVHTLINASPMLLGVALVR